MERMELEQFQESDLYRLGTQCQAGQDVVFVISLDGTRWAVQAFNFTEAAWPGARQGEYALIVLGDGAYSGRAYPFRWQEGALHSGYVGSKLRIDRCERDANDLTRILAVFLGRTLMYPVESKLACYTVEAEYAKEATVVIR